MPHARALAAALLCAGSAAAAAEPPPPLRATAVGVPLAHWSEDFSFGIRFSAAVDAIPRTALHPADAILAAAPDNAAGTRWRLRARPGWSADLRIRIGVNPPAAGAPACTAANVCSAQGAPLEAAVIVHVPARPPDRTWISCERGSVWARRPGSG